ncbi:MAG: hypothetical protein K2O18_06400 [Oscillospiraceae bacterium]|nr:hypothetical protein [Oscillospiraceae bacterium]
MVYSQGIIDFMVYRGPESEKKPIPGVGQVHLPDLLSHHDVPLRLHFVSIHDAAEAMKQPSVQTLIVFAAEQYLDAEKCETGIRRIKHVMRAKPRRLIPGPVYTCCTFEPQLEDERERGSGETIFIGGGMVRQGTICEYDVSYHAAYCDDEKLLEIDLEKRLYMIGGTQYPFPEF